MLNVTFAGLRLRSPLLVAPGAYTTQGDQFGRWVPRLAKNGWGGIVAKSYLSTPDFVHQLKPHLWTSAAYRGLAMQNSGPPPVILDDRAVAALAESTRLAHGEGLIVIASVIGRTVEEWAGMTQKVEEADVDAVELDLGCPARPMKGHPGMLERAAITVEAIRAARRVSKLPLLAKINAQHLNRVRVAQECLEAGADAITAINSVGGIMGIDLQTGRPLCSDIDGRGFMTGISGPIIKPIGLRTVAEIASVVPIPISATGGIGTWEDVAEYMMLGAGCVQICTAAMWYGFGIGRKMYDGLGRYLEVRGLKSLDELRGSSLSYFDHGQQTTDKEVIAHVDEGRCDRCAKCVVACQEGSYGALKFESRVLQVNEGVCLGCGLCQVVCPREAIRMIERKKGGPYV